MVLHVCPRQVFEHIRCIDNKKFASLSTFSVTTGVVLMLILFEFTLSVELLSCSYFLPRDAL